MLANINTSLFLILLIAAIFLTFSVIVGGVIYTIIKVRKNNSPICKKVIIWTVFSIMIAAVSWVLNLGWIRFFLTIVSVPVIHGLAFFISNLFFSKYTAKSAKMSRLNLIYIITYLMIYLLLPDAADYGEMYFFFGLIHSDTLSSVAYYVSVFSVVAHIILFILQIVEMRKLRKKSVDME